MAEKPPGSKPPSPDNTRRVLEDPVRLPDVYKGWVARWVETAGITIPRSNVTGWISKAIGATGTIPVSDPTSPGGVAWTAKAPDADKLDGLDSTAFALVGHNHNDLLPWLIDIDVFATAIAHTNWDTLAAGLDTGTEIAYNARKLSSGAQNDEINWDVVLAAGTWTLEIMHTQGTNRGIYTAALDGTSLGTIDGYAAAIAVNVRSTITGIVVATAGKKRLRLKMATQHASSTGYFGVLQHVQLRRTA